MTDNEVICLKKNGKVKVVHDQIELSKLDADKYEAYLIQVGMFSSVFKTMTPGSKWLKPIKRIHVWYALDRLMEGSFEYYNDNDEPIETDCSINEYGSMELEFTDVLDFIYWVVSLEKMASLNIMGNGGFGHAVYMAGFHMLYQEIGKPEIEFDVPKKMIKKDPLNNYGYGISTLIKSLMEFFDDDDKKFTNPDFYGRRYAYITPDLKEWNFKPSSNRDLVTIPMTQSGCCTLIVTYVFQVLDTLKYMGQVDITTYTCLEEEHNLPFDTPITADTVSYYSASYFDIYDNYTYKLVTAADIIEMTAMLPYYIKTVRDFGNLTSDMLAKELSKERSIIAQLKLFDNTDVFGIPLKHVVYESELEEADMDETTSRFVKELILWIKEPQSIDGLTENDLMPF